MSVSTTSQKLTIVKGKKMAQLEYKSAPRIGTPGRKEDSGFDNVLTYRAQEDIVFGAGLVQGNADERDARLPKQTISTITFVGDFVTANTVTLKVNGETVGPVTFDTDHGTTLAALADEIDDLEGISASVTGARVITVVGQDITPVVTDIVVASGASQTTGSAALSDNEYFVGIALHTQNIEQSPSGSAYYKEGDAVNVLTQGRAYVLTEQDVKAGDDVYVRIIDDGTSKKRGQFRKDSDSNKAIQVTRARFIRGATAGGVAVIEINLP